MARRAPASSSRLSERPANVCAPPAGTRRALWAESPQASHPQPIRLPPAGDGTNGVAVSFLCPRYFCRPLLLSGSFFVFHFSFLTIARSWSHSGWIFSERLAPPKSEHFPVAANYGEGYKLQRECDGRTAFQISRSTNVALAPDLPDCFTVR